jgi:hypothetical protein
VPVPTGALPQQHPRAVSSFREEAIIAGQWFRSVNGALNTIAGYEAMNIIRKGQIRWVAKHDVVGQIRFIERTLGLAA